MTHYVPRVTLDAHRRSRRHVLVAACGTPTPTSVTPTPRLVTCAACLRAMTPEERNP